MAQEKWVLSQLDEGSILTIKTGYRHGSSRTQPNIDIFRPVEGLNGETEEVFILNGDLLPGQMSAGDIFDFAYMRLPKNVKLIDYVLNANSEMDYVQDVGNLNLSNLNSPFWGKVLFGKFAGQFTDFLSANIDFHLCNTRASGGQNAKTGGCPTALHSNVTGQSIPLFYFNPALTVDDTSKSDHKGYFLIPMILPEKTIVFHAIRDKKTLLLPNRDQSTANAIDRLNSEWFNKLNQYAANKAAGIVSHLMIDTEEINRNDEFGIFYTFSIDLIQVASDGTVVPWHTV